MITIEEPLKHHDGTSYIIGVLVLIECKPNSPNAIWTPERKCVEPYFISETEDILLDDDFLAMNGHREWMIDNCDHLGLMEFFTKPKRKFDIMDERRMPHAHGEFKVIVQPKNIPEEINEKIKAGIIKKWPQKAHYPSA